MLFKLPEYLIGSVVSHWIELQDLTKLDTAVCNKKSRIEFLNILSSTWFEFRSETEMNIENAQWISFRKVSVALVEILCYTNKEKVQQNFELITRIAFDWNHLRSFTCTTFKGPQSELKNDCIPLSKLWETIIRNNPKLMFLEVSELADPLLFPICVAVNAPQIESIKLVTNSSVFYLLYFESVIHHCKNLRMVSIRNNMRSSEISVQINKNHEFAVALHNITYETQLLLNFDLNMLRNIKLIGFHAMYLRLFNQSSENNLLLVGI